MVDYDYCLLLLFGVYVDFCPINKWYITIVTWALVVCLIYTPSALGPVALVLWVYISGKPRVPMLQLYIVSLVRYPSINSPSNCCWLQKP